ncbi:Retrovirus-related Pol polyprotein from transposon RE2 [Linum perenne]
MFRPVPACSCQPRCSCGALTKVQDHFRSEQIIRFLRGLNPSFSAVRSQIIRMDPLPTINTVVSMIAQEEQEISGGRGGVSMAQQAAGIVEASAPRAFAANSPGQSVRGKRPICSHCGIIGHTVDKCYKKNGFPPGYRTKRAANSVQSNPAPADDSASDSQLPAKSDAPQQDSDTVSITKDQYQTLYSLFHGHSSAGDVLGPLPSVHYVTSTNGASTSMPTVPSTESQCCVSIDATNRRKTPAKDSHGKASTEKGTILSLSSKSFSTGNVWVVDSGATDHIAYSIDFLDHYQTVSNSFVSLPNGSSVPITHIGSIVCNKNLVLQNVLIIPSFRFNLLSVSKLSAQNSCVAIFSTASCVFQDTRTSKMIGTADLWNGLYYMSLSKNSPQQHSCSATQSFFDLWHFRLGHTSVKGLVQSLSPKNPANFHCVVCPIAKQRKLPFSSSESLAHRPFSLVHIDI